MSRPAGWAEDILIEEVAKRPVPSPPELRWRARCEGIAEWVDRGHDQSPVERGECLSDQEHRNGKRQYFGGVLQGERNPRPTPLRQMKAERDRRDHRRRTNGDALPIPRR